MHIASINRHNKNETLFVDIFQYWRFMETNDVLRANDLRQVLRGLHLVCGQ